MALFGPKKKNVAPSSLWDDDQLAEAPVVKSKAVQLSSRWVRAFRTYTKVSIWAMPVIALLLLTIYSDMNAEVVVDKVAVSDQVNSEGKSYAIVSENAWLASVPAPLVDGRIVAWNGFDVKKIPKLNETVGKAVVAPDYRVEVHHFTLTDSQGLQYSSEVAVAVSEKSGATALGTPSLTPLAPVAEGWANKGVWYGLKTETASSPVISAVTAWSKAFTSGDPDVLRLAVGDKDSKHSYVPLTGVTAAEPRVVVAGSEPILTKDGNISDEPAKTLIVQVQLQLTWGTPPAVINSAGNSLITYDLLIEQADTAAPVVVSWGGAGSGTSLKAYDQAVVDRTVVAEGAE